MENQEQNLPQKEQPFVAAKQVSFNLEDIILKQTMRKPFTKSPNMYQEYMAELGSNTFRNAIDGQYLPHSSEYVAPPSIDVVRKWFPTIGPHAMVFKAPTTSLKAKSVSQGAKPGAKTGHKKPVTSSKQPYVSSKEATKGRPSKAPTGFKTSHSKRRKESSSAMDSNPSRPSVSTPVDTEMHKEDQQATSGPTSLGVTSEERSNPQLSSGTDPHVLADQTKSVSEGLETVLTQPTTEKEASFIDVHGDKEEASTAIHGDKEEAFSTIKLEDLAKLVSKIQPRFKDLDSPKDDPVIIVDESDEDEPNAETEDTSSLDPHLLEEFLSLLAKVESAQAKLKTLDALPSLLLNVTKSLNKFAEANTMPAEGEKDTNQATISQLFQRRADKIAEAEKKLNQHPKSTTPPTTTPINPPIITTTTQMQTPLQSPPRSSSQPEGEHIKKDKGKKVMSSEEAEKESPESDNNEEAYVTGSMLEEEAKAEAAKQEGEVRKAELIDLLGPEVVHKYYNYKLQYDRYCDKMLNRRAGSRITNCDVLTRKGPITFNVYKEDDTYEVISNFKVSDMHLELGINLDISLSMQDPFDKLNDLANKKRKHANDIHDYFKETKKLKSLVEYGDYLPRTVLKEHVLGMIMFNSYHRHDFLTIEDLNDFSNAMLYTVQEILFRRHQGLGVDEHARTFSSLLLAEVDKRNLNPLKHMRTIEQLKQ
nr:hypothetical protein [Tanacetum cinerariifolium]